MINALAHEHFIGAQAVSFNFDLKISGKTQRIGQVELPY
jgi:NO-binding membrane sensor protein with MHYT domain